MNILVSLFFKLNYVEMELKNKQMAISHKTSSLQNVLYNINHISISAGMLMRLDWKFFRISYFCEWKLG